MISELLGKTTIPITKNGHVQYIARMLMTPSEIRTLKRNEALLVYANRMPIRLELTPWYKQFWLRWRIARPFEKLDRSTS